MRRIWTRYAFGVAALALVLASGSASAWECDFLTGGGFIIRDSGAKANFGVGGGCKHGSPTWGHLEYQDHGTGLNVHWTRRPISPPVPGRSVARPGRTSSEIGRAHV